MARNNIQFQEGLSVKEFFNSYGTEEQCRKALFNAKWSTGGKCERCEIKE